MEAPQAGMIQLATVLRFVDIATDALAGAREEIDALNVYPVPDGDTGTNMYLTVSAARDAIREAAGDDPKGADSGKALAAFSRGALLGARGNSGVILSQMLGAIAAPHRRAAARRAERDGHGRGAPAGHRRELRRGRRAGRGHDPHRRPRRLGRRDGARRRPGQPRAATCSPWPPEAAREALARTPEQLAGAARRRRRGRRRPRPQRDPRRRRDGAHRPPAGTGADPDRASTTSRSRCPADDLTADGPAYEVMYLLDADDDRIPELRRDPRAARRLARRRRRRGAVERPRARRRRRRRDRGRHRRRPAAPGPGHPLRRAGRRAPARRPPHRRGRRIVAVAAGPGLAALFAEAGAVVVEGGPGRRPSTGQVLEAITACGAAEVVVLPNDPDSVPRRRDRRPDRRERRGHDASR